MCSRSHHYGCDSEFETGSKSLQQRSPCCFSDPGRRSLLLLPLQLSHIIHKTEDGPLAFIQPYVRMEYCQKGQENDFCISFPSKFLSSASNFGDIFYVQNCFLVCGFPVSAIKKRIIRARCIICRAQCKMKMQSLLFKKQGK